MNAALSDGLVTGVLAERGARRQSLPMSDRELSQARSRFYRAIRDFFDARDFVEVETPLLGSHLIPESAIEVFQTELKHLHRSSDALFLLPSPEMYMKILISEGIGDCFQLCKVFRNAEHYSPRHHAEFTMLEWYAIGRDYHENIHLTQELLKSLAPSAHPDSRHLFENFIEIRMRDLVLETTGIDLSFCEQYEGLIKEARRAGFTDYVEHSQDWEELFNRIFLSDVEPKMPVDKTVFLTDYPAQIPTTARRVGSIYERWEFYMKGWEMANCYTEEASYDEMCALFVREQAAKANMMTPHPVDYGYLTLFNKAFPACSGVAMGVDRVFTVHQNLASLDAVSLFPMSAALK